MFLICFVVDLLEFDSDPLFHALTMHVASVSRAATWCNMFVLVEGIERVAEAAFDFEQITLRIEVVMMDEATVGHRRLL